MIAPLSVFLLAVCVRLSVYLVVALSVCLPVCLSACLMSVHQLGPSSATLDHLGAKNAYKIRNFNQAYRFFSPMFLHGGIVHLVVNMAVLMRMGAAYHRRIYRRRRRRLRCRSPLSAFALAALRCFFIVARLCFACGVVIRSFVSLPLPLPLPLPLVCVIVGWSMEEAFGWVRVGVVYLVSGIFSMMVSALFLPGALSVGASGALFGLIGALLGDFMQNHHLMEEGKWCYLFQLIFSIVVGLVVGLFPLVRTCHATGCRCSPRRESYLVCIILYSFA